MSYLIAYSYYLGQLLLFIATVIGIVILGIVAWSMSKNYFNLQELEDKVKNIFKGVNKKLDEKIIKDYAE